MPLTAAQPTRTGKQLQRRRRSHDVGRGPTLEQQRVDEDVEQDRGVGQRGRQPVGGQAEQRGGARAEHDAPDQRGGGGDDALLVDQRAAGGALHDRVDVAVEVAVDRVGAAGREGAADQRDGDERQGTGGRAGPAASSRGPAWSPGVSSMMRDGAWSARRARQPRPPGRCGGGRAAGSRRPPSTIGVTGSAAGRRVTRAGRPCLLIADASAVSAAPEPGASEAEAARSGLLAGTGQGPGHPSGHLRGRDRARLPGGDRG